MEKKLVEFRKQIHKAPELSNEENRTSKKVAKFLRALDPDRVITSVGGNGVIAVFDSGEEGPTLMFRAELDALPIKEIGDIEYRSQKENVSHMCGHDGHMTILLGLAQRIRKEGIRKGKVILLFQPGEENGTGAKAMLNDENYSLPDIDFVFALHNLPGFPLHRVIVKTEAFTPHVISLILKLEGKTSHAAEPEKGNNPALALARILEVCDQLDTKDDDDEDFYLITPIHISMGEIAYGISAGQADLHLTLRSWTKETLTKKNKKLLSKIKDICESEGIQLRHEWTHEFYSNINDAKAVTIIEKAATKAGLDIFKKKMPFKWGEDFGLFTQKYKGAMFGLGAGEDWPALHNPDYDFPDELIDTGINVFYNIINNLLN